ncbi:GNAT family N-acetyltransferase, partial [Clostridioides difficile]
KSVIEFCFSKTELQKIMDRCAYFNHASYKTLEKVGFQREGHIREGKMVNTYCDYYLYGILKSDYSTI